MPRTRAPPDRHGDSNALFDQPGHEMAPDKTGAADDEHIRELHLAPGINASKLSGRILFRPHRRTGCCQ
jgi:hypothetical protein